MPRVYDVAVIGAGPIGSFTAQKLADRGLAVCLVDEKKQVGKDVLCTGIVSKEAFKRYDLPTAAILSRINSFTFFSPSGQRLDYLHPDVFAYVISRERFDDTLLTMARRYGVEVYLRYRVKGIDISNHSYTLKGEGLRIRSRAVVLATGVRYELHSNVGIGQPANFLYGSQLELPLSTPRETIEIHLGKHFAPCSFAWIAPINHQGSRVGVIVKEKGTIWLRRMLKDRIGCENKALNKKVVRVKPIAFGAVKRSAKGRILAVGEAAGQVKTTTGGGIFFGLLCSEIAVEKLSRALKNGHSLEDYDITWRSILNPEIEIGKQLRKIARNLDDEIIEELFRFVKKNRFWVQFLRPRIDYDFHSNLLYFCLKSFQSLLGNR